MKRCPECRKDYLDDSLLYCLDDGTPLVQGTVTDEPATAILSGNGRSDEASTLALPAVRTGSFSAALAKTFSRERLPWWLAAFLAVLAVIGFGIGYSRGRSANTIPVRLAFEPPTELSFNDDQPDHATVSPDGRMIAFSATADGKNMLYVRNLETGEAKLLPGSDSPLEPFWSPDSRSIAYGSQGKLKRSDLSGGNAQVLCDAARSVGGSWNQDGTIVFVPDFRKTVVQVSAKGGDPTPVAMNFPAGDGQRHRYPYFLPGGRRFLFLVEESGIWAGSLDSPEITQVTAESSPTVYSKDGYLIFVRNDTLVAQTFDPVTLKLSGEPIAIIPDRRSWVNNFRFSVSDTGVLVFQGVWEREYQLTWLDREGKSVGMVEAPSKVAVGQDPRISPDGKRVVVKRNPPNTLWVADLEKGTSIRITSDFSQMPVWSPDGSRLAYSGSGGLSTKASSGLGEPEVILLSAEFGGAMFPCCWTPDGRHIIYQKRGVKTRVDLYAVALDEKKEILLINSPFDERSPALSPDGKWLAYFADDTGSWEVYVQSFSPDAKLGSDRKRVSTTGGRMPVWSRDGRELFFIAADGQLMSASVKTSGETFEFETPKALFKTRMLADFGSFHEFDVSPDGQRFLIGTLVGDTKAPAPTVILNWTALVKK